MTTPTGTLRHAATYLARYGWAQDTFYTKPAGELFPAADVVGAIRAVICGTPVTDLTTRTRDEVDAVKAAQKTLVGFLDLDALYGGHGFTDEYILATWNDLPCQDAAGIISTLKAAADHRDTTRAATQSRRLFALAGAR